MAAGDSRYLYLRGASRTNLPPYGLSDLLAGTQDARRDVVLVEGFFDLHQLQRARIENVAALGGTSVSRGRSSDSTASASKRVTLCLDNDEAGRAATARAVENCRTRPREPRRLRDRP